MTGIGLLRRKTEQPTKLVVEKIIAVVSFVILLE